MHHWSDRFCTAPALSNFVTDISGIKIRENQNPGLAFQLAVRGLASSHFRHNRSIELELTVEGEDEDAAIAGICELVEAGFYELDD